MLCVLQKVKIIDDRLIFMKLSTKTAFLYIETVFFRQHACFYSYLYIEEKNINHIRIIGLLLKLDTSGAIDFFWSFWTFFNLFLMDSAAKILLKYVKNIISRGNSRSSIQLDLKFGRKFCSNFELPTH